MECDWLVHCRCIKHGQYQYSYVLNNLIGSECLPDLAGAVLAEVLTDSSR